MATSAQFNRLSISVRDFEQAAAFAERALEVPRSDLAHQALLFAAIVCYYRPFSPNEKKVTPKATAALSIADFPNLTAEDQALHEECKNLRNKALAHSEYDWNPTKLHEDTGVISSRPFDLLARGPDPLKLARLAKTLGNACHHWRADLIHHPGGGRSAA